MNSFACALISKGCGYIKRLGKFALERSKVRAQGQSWRNVQKFRWDCADRRPFGARVFSSSIVTRGQSPSADGKSAAFMIFRNEFALGSSATAAKRVADIATYSPWM